MGISDLVKILKILGLTKEEYITLDGDNAGGFVGGLIRSETDKRSWAEKENERDNEGWEVVS